MTENNEINIAYMAGYERAKDKTELAVLLAVRNTATECLEIAKGWDMGELVARDIKERFEL